MTLDEIAIREPRRVNGDQSWNVGSNYYFCPMLCKNCKYFYYEKSTLPYHCKGPHSMAASHTSKREGFKQYDYCYCYDPVKPETAPVKTEQQPAKPADNPVVNVQSKPAEAEPSKPEEREPLRLSSCEFCGKDVYDNEEYTILFSAVFHEECYNKFKETDEGREWYDQEYTSALNSLLKSKDFANYFSESEQEEYKKLADKDIQHDHQHLLYKIERLIRLRKETEQIDELLNSPETGDYLSEIEKEKYRETIGKYDDAYYIEQEKKKIKKEIARRRYIEKQINEFAEEKYEHFFIKEDFSMLCGKLKNLFASQEFERLEEILGRDLYGIRFKDVYLREPQQKSGLIKGTILFFWNIGCILMIAISLLGTCVASENLAKERFNAVVTGIVFIFIVIDGIMLKKLKIKHIKKRNFRLINEKLS